MDMTATTPNIEARIAAERKRLFDEQALQVELEKQRLIPLEAGNDEVLDEIEIKIAKSIERAERVQERIALLEHRLTESKSLDENTRLDEIASAAQRARERGLSILKKYGKAAKATADALAELRDCEITIAECNVALTAAKRDTVSPADPPRFPITGTNGLGLTVVALHEVANLPNETPDVAAYWSSRDIRYEVTLASLGYPNPQNRKLLVP